MLVISRKPRSIASYWRITGTKTVAFEFDLRTFDKAAWPALVLAAFSQMDVKPTPLSALYDTMQNYARVQLPEREGIDWRAQVRRILQSYACFEQVEYGVWKLKSEQMPKQFTKTH